MNQDRLEQFFGIIRQAAGPNDHSRQFQHFCNCYKLLSVYTLIKPPKYGNCTVQDELNKPVVSLVDYDKIFMKVTSHSKKHVAELKEKLDSLISVTDWECEDVIPIDHNYSSTNVVSCIVYYVTGFLCKKLRKKYPCDTCQVGFQSTKGNVNNSSQLLINIKTRGGLIHTNTFLHSFILNIEEYFSKH